MVKGKTILVTGAEVQLVINCRQLLTYEPAKLLLLDNDETRVTRSFVKITQIPS